MSSPSVQPTFEIREYRRVPVHCPVYFYHGYQYGEGTAWNLSCGGCRLDSEVPLVAGAILKVFVMIPEMPCRMMVEQAIVRWSRGQEVGLAIRLIYRADAIRLLHFVAKSLTPRATY